jgi:Cu-Zn family superoxide dismutase
MFMRVLALLAPLSLITACASSIDSGSSSPLVSAAPAASATSAWTVYQGSASPSPSSSFGADLTVSGTFLPYRVGSTAVTYDPAVVPAGASATLAITKLPAGMRVTLSASGMIPRRAYGAHLHTQPCAALPDQAGPHYQHRHDPATPSVDPEFANPKNEVWLDFTASATGAASAVSEQDWHFPTGETARSLILHARQTRTGAGIAGTAGPRVGCLTLPAG